MAEAIGLKITVSQSPSKAAPSYKTSSKSTNGLEVIGGGHTHRQAGDLINLLSMLEKEAKNIPVNKELQCIHYDTTSSSHLLAGAA
jgi:hypothetical protein